MGDLRKDGPAGLRESVVGAPDGYDKEPVV